MKSVWGVLLSVGLLAAPSAWAGGETGSGRGATSAQGNERDAAGTDGVDDAKETAAAAGEAAEEDSDMSPLYMGLASAVIVLLPLNYIVGPFAPVLWAIEAAVIAGAISDWQWLPMVSTAGTVVLAGLVGLAAPIAAYVGAAYVMFTLVGGPKATGAAAEAAGGIAQGAGYAAAGVTTLVAVGAVTGAAAGVYWLTASDESAAE